MPDRPVRADRRPCAQSFGRDWDEDRDKPKPTKASSPDEDEAFDYLTGEK